jgi:hypothetical protein
MDNFSLISAYSARPSITASYYSMDILILAGEERVSMALADTLEGQLFSVHEYLIKGGTASIEALLSSEEAFSKPYRSCTIGLQSAHSTLLPLALFDETRLESYLSFGQDIPGNAVLRTDEPGGTDMVNAYSLPGDLYSLFSGRFPSARIVHFNTALLAGLNARMKRSGSDSMVSCHLRQGQMDLVIFKSGKFQLYNTFRFSNKEELIYYILFVLDQLGMNPSGQEAVFFGEIEKDEELVAFCREYLGEVRFGEARDEGMASMVSGPFPFHRYFNLLSLRLCA